MNFRHIAAVMVIATGGTLFALPAAPATAAVAGQQVLLFSSKVTGTATNQHLTATVMCPAGRKVVSLGATGTRITSLRPTPDFNGAVATAIVWTGPSLTVIAGCVPEAEVQDVTRITLRIHVRTPGFRDGIERCPAGMYAFGGGGGFGNGGDANDMSANLVTVDGRGWEYAGVVVNPSDTTQVDVQCAPDTGSTFLVSAGMPGQEGVTQTAEAKCPAPYWAFSGGAYLANPDGSPADGLILESVPATGGSWRVRGTAPIGGKVVAVVRCTL